MFDADSLAGDSLRPLKMRSWWCRGGGSVRDAGALTQSPAGKLPSNTNQNPPEGFFSTVSLPPCDRGLAVL